MRGLFSLSSSHSSDESWSRLLMTGNRVFWIRFMLFRKSNAMLKFQFWPKYLVWRYCLSFSLFFPRYYLQFVLSHCHRKKTQVNEISHRISVFPKWFKKYSFEIFTYTVVIIWSEKYTKSAFYKYSPKKKNLIKTLKTRIMNKEGNKRNCEWPLSLKSKVTSTSGSWKIEPAFKFYAKYLFVFFFYNCVKISLNNCYSFIFLNVFLNLKW